MSKTLTAAERVAIARHPGRPNVSDYISALFTDFFVQRGDRQCKEDESILGGIAVGLLPRRGSRMRWIFPVVCLCVMLITEAVWQLDRQVNVKIVLQVLAARL